MLFQLETVGDEASNQYGDGDYERIYRLTGDPDEFITYLFLLGYIYAGKVKEFDRHSRLFTHEDSDSNIEYIHPTKPRQTYKEYTGCWAINDWVFTEHNILPTTLVTNPQFGKLHHD